MNPSRSVLITGGASGIGLATARAFVGRGHPVLLADVNAAVHEVARSLSSPSVPVHAFEVDMGDESQVLALAARALQLFGTCDVLVNCAGVSQKRDGKAIPPTEVVTADWERVLRINLTGPFLLCRELIPAMQRKRFGRIINVASRAGRTFSKGAGSDYAASKAGLIGLTRHLAGSYATDGITVNAVAPGRVHTPLANTSSAEVLAKAVQEIPAGRFGTPEEIAEAIVFLASEGAAYVTGTCLDVNGGGFMS